MDLLKACKGHANILQLLDKFESSTHFRLVIEKVDGGELFLQVEERKVFTEREASEVVQVQCVCVRARVP